MLDYGNGDELYWDATHEEVRFQVHDAPRSLVCRLQAGALGRYGVDAADPEGCVRAAQEHFDHFCHRISDKLALGLLEPDGSVLVRARDW